MRKVGETGKRGTLSRFGIGAAPSFSLGQTGQQRAGTRGRKKKRGTCAIFLPHSPTTLLYPCIAFNSKQLRVRSTGHVINVFSVTFEITFEFFFFF